jgi:DNA polymerase elongation subunit (family B)
MDYEFRLLDFNAKDEVEQVELIEELYNESGDKTSEVSRNICGNKFTIQMFGINEKGETCSILIDDFQPYFYVKVSNNWTTRDKDKLFNFIKKKLGKYYDESLVACSMIEKKKLYGFDDGKLHKFIVLKFDNIVAFNRAKGFWYDKWTDEDDIYHSVLKKKGLVINNCCTQLYEANIPPLLRYFHINDISPSGWIKLPKNKYSLITDKTTTCTYEFTIQASDVVPLNEKETIVPYKICSFDIEANSSHGDFPLPIKRYKKLAYNMIDILKKSDIDSQDKMIEFISNCIYSALEVDHIIDIENVYLKTSVTKDRLDKMIHSILSTDLRNENVNGENNIEDYFDTCRLDDDDCTFNNSSNSANVKGNIVDILLSSSYDRETKMNELTNILNSKLPAVKGDEVTFIGSTFMRYGEKQPYLNHCIVLNTCSSLKNGVIETYKTERDVLLAWQKLIEQENPDIIIGYNIFGFDYEFLFRRAKENSCENEFLKLSRNVDEVCGNFHPTEGINNIETSSIVIASGQHDLKYIKMGGRIQIDLYNYFRRDFNLTSYKLDYVSGHFMCDKITEINHENDKTIIKTKNMVGLYEGSYIHFEEIAHSSDYYKDGAKFLVTKMLSDGFEIDGYEYPNMKKTVKWCLAKDDITPQDIFEKTKGDDNDRMVIAKYCIQDCNLVHELLNKIDVVTGFIEMSKLCSIPISYLILRGQGIKLTSFISKKCRENDTLMPVINKGSGDEGYEGAIVLDPKCNLYLDDPVACVDYGSLYPSSMISENLCHTSKVWTKEYDLQNNLIQETGEKNENGEFIYDNYKNYKYVDVTYDTFKYVRKNPKAAATKVQKGYKICRFAQYPDKKAILPSVLEELLKSRKLTKKLMAKESDPFMKNILDKRQLSIKLTANSLYGQCGAKTSTFYEKDIAASTTATGRKLLTYAKRLIEEVYGDSVCETKNYGQVRTNASYIYGDTDSVFFCFYLKEMDGTPIKGKKALEITIELAQEAGTLASKFLKGPHDLEYEKTFLPFCLLSKKRYVGMLYEFDINKGNRKEMGIVLKRRDNAPIVKDVYGGIIDILMKEQDIQKAIEFLTRCLQDIVDEKCPIEKLIITKSLRSNYKNPDQIAHKVLADRMGVRDPGNKPSSGDRIPFAYIHNENRKALQGDKIEHPQYINDNKLKLDYGHYITNQIMKPLLQVFSLVLDDMPNFKNKLLKKKKMDAEIAKYKRELDSEKFEKKVETIKNKEVQSLLFDKYIRMCNNMKQQNKTITSFFMK